MPEDPMRCSVPEEELSALVDGELAEERAHELRSHATTCARCAERVAAFERAGVLLSALPARPVPADLRARLQARIDAEGAEAAAPVSRTPTRAAPPSRRRWLGSRVFATAAALAAAVALFWALAPGQRSGPGSEIERPPIARQESPPPAPAPTPELDPAPELPNVPEPLAPQIAETTPAPAAPQIAEAKPEPSPTAADAEFDPVPAEEIAVALELETIEDLDVIANLELLEALVALGEGTG